jgi:hypothetical protein
VYDPRGEAELAASIVVRQNVLLAGQMAIMREQYYEEAKIDFTSMQRWFRDIGESFERLIAQDKVFVRDEVNGLEKECMEFVATRGAVEWQRSGRALRQFLNGAYTFTTHG